MQFPIFGLPRELGLKGAVFADAGTLFGYKGPEHLRREQEHDHRRLRPDTGCTLDPNVTQECILVRDNKDIRSSVGASLLWSFAAWSDPVRLRLRADARTMASSINGVRIGGDRTQAFRFSGGTRF